MEIYADGDERVFVSDAYEIGFDDGHAEGRAEAIIEANRLRQEQRRLAYLAALRYHPLRLKSGSAAAVTAQLRTKRLNRQVVERQCAAEAVRPGQEGIGSPT